jgi:PAS domain S-box-containing protein
MTQPYSTPELLSELAALRTRLEEAEDTLTAIQQDRVDALVVDGPQGERVFTIQGADQPYRVMIESMQEGALTLTADGTVLFSNPSFARLVQMPLEQILGSNVRQFIAAAEQEQFVVLLTHGIAGSSVDELHLTTSDGVQVPVSLSLTSLRAYDVPAVCMIVTDLTDRKRYTALAEVQQALRESEARVRTLAESLPALVWMAQPDGFLDYYNQRWFDYTGLSEAQLTGWGWQAVWHPEDLPDGRTRWRESLRTGQPYEYQARLLRAVDGSYRWHLIRAVPVLDSERRVLRWFGTNTDIEEQQRTVVELQRLNEDPQQFSRIVSHDLNEPLRTMSGFVTLLAQRYQGKLDATADEYISFVTDAAQRMQQLIQDLLAYTRVGQPQEFTTVDCEALFTRVVAALQMQITECGATVTHDPLPTVLGDATRLGQVLQNLIGNALKFRGQASPHIHVAAVTEEHQWRFAVRDNGIGIDPSQTERIFQVFQRLHTLSEYPGTGIDLAICKKIVEQHGGRIWVESQPGQGSTFYFTVSAEDGENPTSSPLPTQASSSGTAPRSS